MRSRASDVMGSTTRSRSVDRVSNSNIDLSRLTRSVTETTTSGRFNSLNRIRGSQKLDKKLVGSNTSVCSTLPTRGRANNGRPMLPIPQQQQQQQNKYNFKSDPCYTSNIEHLVYANSTRSSFNVKYGSNYPLSKNNSIDRRLPEEKKFPQRVAGNKTRTESFNRQPVNKTKMGLNSSSGGSRSFDTNAFQQSTSLAKPKAHQPPTNRQNSNPGARIKPQHSAGNSLTPSPTSSSQGVSRSNSNAMKYSAGKQANCYASKQSDVANKPSGSCNTSGNGASSRRDASCNQYQQQAPANMLHSGKITTTTTILQETTPNRRNNVSILQVRSVSEPNPQQPIKHQVNISTIPASSNPVARVVNPSRNNSLLLPPRTGSNIPVYRYQSNAANLWKSAAGKIVTCNASNKAKLAAAKAASSNNANEQEPNREMSPVRWCDEEVAGVYLGRSGWVQVCGPSNQQSAQRSAVTKASSTDSDQHGSRLNRPESLNISPVLTENQPYARESQQYSRSVSAPVHPDPLCLSDEDSMLSLNTPIISPPLAFQDERETRPSRNKLPRSNAFDFPDPDEVTKMFLQASGSEAPRYSPTKKQASPSKLRSKVSSEESSGSTGSFRTAASSGGMRSVTPSWRGGGGERGGGSRLSCGDSCSSGSSRRRSSSEESISFLPGALNLSPDATPKRHAPKQPAPSRHHNSGRHNGVQHLSDTATAPVRRHHHATVRKTVTSPESSTSSASSSPARQHSRNRRVADAPQHHSKSRSTSQRTVHQSAPRYGNRLSPQSQPPQYQRPTSPHVTRSTSLQLPAHADYPARVDARARTQQERSAPPRTTQTGKTRSVDNDMSLGWHQAELRAVTDYLSSARSRNAARALLLQRYLNQQGISPEVDEDLASDILEPIENPPPSGRNSSASYNVVYIDKKQKRAAEKSRAPWKRGTSTPTSEKEEKEKRQLNKYQQYCNPATCDFWPECEHASVTTKNDKKPYLCQMRSSLSYPAPCDQLLHPTRSFQQQSTKQQQPQVQRNGRDRSITAPCSLDRVDEDHSTHVITIPKRDIYSRECSPIEKNGFRNSSSEDISTSADDLDDNKWKNKVTITTPDKSSDSSGKLSPNQNKSLLSPSNNSSRPHSADCLLRRRTTPTNQQYNTHSERNSPIVEETPMQDKVSIRNQHVVTEPKGAQQRSLSLPKSFMSNRQPARPKMPAEFTGLSDEIRSQDERSGLLLPVGAYTTVSALSTPNTPGHVSHKSEGGNDRSCFGTSSNKDRLSPGQNSSGFLASALRHAGLGSQAAKHRRRASANELSVLQKFKKSLTQRFTRKSSKSRDLSLDMSDSAVITPDKDDDIPIIQDLLLPASQLETDAYFKRIGPVWRQKDPSCSTNGGGKSCRNSKCSSGDSGFHMEETLKSLETESTPQDLSPEIQRRVKSPASNENGTKKSRPLSEVLNETFLEKYKLEGGENNQADNSSLRVNGNTGSQVRRTHSDLSGSPLIREHNVPRNVFKRQISSPSPLKMRPVHCLSRDHGMNSASEDDELETIQSNVVLRRTSAASTDSNASVMSATPIQRQQQLRRSISQPMGINELSPLLRRRPSGVPSVVPRRVARGRRGRARRRSKVGAGACSEDENRGAASSDYDEDDETDSECSSASDLSRKHSYEIRPLAQVVLAEAVWDHVTLDSEELAFQAGTLIEVVDCTSDKDWWFGHVGDKKGWFPAAFVRFRVSQDDTLEDCLASMAAAKSPSPSERTVTDKTAVSPHVDQKAHSRTRSSVSLLSNDQVRASVVREILSTERDFVRNLTDVVEGYLWECRRREDLFTSQQLGTIFGNIEEILAFQSSFLSALETRVNLDDPCSSCLGHTFLQHSSGFHVYSEYCNGNHIAQATLQELCSQPGYRQFFEACRLVRGLINISLDGFLLTPVQRICKYPLQLAELLKYTRMDHPDYEEVRAALEAMRSVATLVNERKRRMESLEKLAAWQQRVEGWEGEDLIDLSSQLIHQGEAVRVTSGRWSSNVKLFLFDRQLLYCKRDLLRRGLFVYKGRIALDHCQVMDVPDGKDIHLGISVRHGIKLVSRSGPSGRPTVSRGAVQWLLLCFRSADEKRGWLHALAEERALVTAEQARGLQLEPSAREIARLLTSRHSARPAYKPHAKGYSKRRAREAAHLVPHLATSETSLGASCQSISGDHQNSLGRKVGHWFTFSSKSKQHRRSPPNRGGSLQQLLPQ